MIKVYIGDIGSGKTLSLVRDVYKEHVLEGNTIYTNTPIESNVIGEDQVRIMDKEFFKQFNDKSTQLQDCAVIIDEAHIFMDSRRSMSNKNVIFSKFVTQSRKKSVDLYLTSQDKSPEHFLKSGQIELRIRKLVDRIIMCETYCKIDGKWYKNYDDHVENNERLWVMNYVHDKYLDPVKHRVFIGNKYFGIYNTDKIIDIDIE